MIFVKVIPPLFTGINEKVLNPAIIIFPNPASDHFILEMTNISKANLRIFNLLGELKYSSIITSRQTSIDVSAMADGVYIVELAIAKGVMRIKFIKE